MVEGSIRMLSEERTAVVDESVVVFSDNDCVVPAGGGKIVPTDIKVIKGTEIDSNIKTDSEQRDHKTDPDHNVSPSETFT